MSDYKELLKTLRALCSIKDYEPCDYNLEAADAIEQLVKERDYAMGIANNTHCSAMKKFQKNDETIAGLFRDRDILRRERDELVTKCHQLEKERDAAVTEIEKNCYHCKHSVLYRYLGIDYNDCEFYKTGNCKCRDKWEWRGVQDE